MGNDEYNEAAPMWALLFLNRDSVTATEKYTIVFKFKKQAALAFQGVTDLNGINCFEAPEVAKIAPPGGNVDAKYAIGTGPWMLAEYVSGSSVTFNKNPDYWGTDPRYPGKKLPYADSLKILIIPDMSTAIASSYYGGMVYGNPCGWLSPAMKGYAYEYADWPQALKDEYAYNPTKAKELLAEASQLRTEADKYTIEQHWGRSRLSLFYVRSLAALS